MSICFAEFQNPTWNCRGICPLDGRARCITGVSSWKPGSFAFFTLLRDEPPPLSAFAPIEWKASVVTHPATLSIFFYLRTTPPPFYFSWNNLFTNADIKFVTLCNFYGEFVLVSTNSHSSVLFKFRNLLSFVFFSFVFFFSLWFLWNFNICYDNICNIFLYFEFSNLEEKIVKWFASNNIISTK